MCKGVLLIKIDDELHEGLQQAKRVDDHVVDKKTLSWLSN